MSPSRLQRLPHSTLLLFSWHWFSSGNNLSKELSASYLIVLKCKHKARTCFIVTWAHDCLFEHSKAESGSGNGSGAGHQDISNPLPGPAGSGPAHSYGGYCPREEGAGNPISANSDSMWLPGPSPGHISPLPLVLLHPWKRIFGGVTRLGFISSNFRHPCFVCLRLIQSSGIFAIGKRNSCSSGVIHPPGLA